jgi:hypothetical protein
LHISLIDLCTMASEAPASAQTTTQYREDWLPEDFKPLTFKQLCWAKLKSAPLVGVGTSSSRAGFQELF